MEAKELRIGNWVDYNGRHGIITTIGKKSVIIELGTVINEHSAYTKSENPNLDEIAGIPLIEEWLLRFSFIKDGDYFSFGNLHYHLPTGSFYVGNDHVSSGHDDGKIEFVHQLQNLFFALTGKELTLKEN